MHTYNDDQQTQREIQDRYKAAKAKLDGVRGVVDAVAKGKPAPTPAEEVNELRQAIRQVGEIVAR